MQLEDFLGMQQTAVTTLNNFATTSQDTETKQLFQQMAEKNQQHFDNVSKNLSAGQN